MAGIGAWLTSLDYYSSQVVIHGWVISKSYVVYFYTKATKCIQKININTIYWFTLRGLISLIQYKTRFKHQDNCVTLK